MKTKVFSSMRKLVVDLYQLPCLSHIHRLKSVFCFFPWMWNKELRILAKQSGYRILSDFYMSTSKLSSITLLTSILTADFKNDSFLLLSLYKAYNLDFMKPYFPFLPSLPFPSLSPSIPSFLPPFCYSLLIFTVLSKQYICSSNCNQHDQVWHYLKWLNWAEMFQQASE